MTRPSCPRVKVQVNLLGDLLEFMELEIKSNEENMSRVVQIKVDYNILLKYYKRYKLQRHNKANCRVLHPELRRQEHRGVEESNGGDRNNPPRNPIKQWHPTNRIFTRTSNMEVTTKGMQLVKIISLLVILLMQLNLMKMRNSGRGGGGGEGGRNR